MPTMEANQAERQRWKTIAPIVRRERFTESVTPLLLNALNLKPGERVLDIGCGGGLATSAAAKIIGDRGKAVGADISVPLIDLARRRAAASDVTNIAFQVKDVQQDRIDGAPFDVAMSQFGVMFFDEPKTAFANIRAHLAPHGRLGFVCWQSAAKNPWFLGPILADMIPPPPLPLPGKSPRGPFAFADPIYVRGILQAAGFGEIAITNHDYSIEAPENSMIDEAQLVFFGVPREKMLQASAAVDKHMAPFRLTSGLCRFLLAVQIFTAYNPAR